VVVVDDGSQDRTAEVAELAGARVLRHRRNQGKGEAYRTLWAYAREHGFDALVCLDGDGQHDPDEAPLLLARLQHGDDLVVGTRWGKRTGMPLWRRVGKRILDYGTALASSRSGKGPILTDSQSGFRAYSRRALEAIAPDSAGFSVESQLLVDANAKGLRIGETRIHCRYDVKGSTQGPVNHASSVLNDILVMVGIRHPLLLLGVPGVAAGLLALVALTLGLTDHTGGFDRFAFFVVAAFLFVLGVVGVFAGLLFNILPRIVRDPGRRRGGGE